MWNNQRALNFVTAALLLLVVVMLASAAAVWVSQRPYFTLKRIQIESATPGVQLRHVNVATVRAAALPRVLRNTRGNFFSADLETVRLAIESVAWVRRAQVRREWPDRLVVRIEEHEVLGSWGEGRLISRLGEVFTANLDEAEAVADGKLPVLSGPPGSEKEVAARYGDFNKWFAPLGLVPESVTLSARYAWIVHLNNGTEAGLRLELGRENNKQTLAERVDRLIAAYPLLTGKWPKLTHVDLRYPNGFALRAEGLRLESDANARIGAGILARPAAAKPASPATRAKSNSKPVASHASKRA